MDCLQDIITSQFFSFYSKDGYFTEEDIFKAVKENISPSEFYNNEAKIRKLFENTLLMLKFTQAIKYNRDKKKYYFVLSFPSI